MKDEKLILRAKFDKPSQKWYIEKKLDVNEKYALFGSIENTTFDYWKDAEKHIDKLVTEFPDKFIKAT